MSEVAEKEKFKVPMHMQAGGSVKAIVPTNFDDAYRVANVICQAGMAPDGMNTPERAMVAIMHANGRIAINRRDQRAPDHLG